MDDQYKKSLELIDKFIKEISPEELQRLIDRVDTLKHSGPTVEEYLKYVDDNQLQILQDEIKKWSDGAFGLGRTGIPIAYHLKKETNEVIEALEYHHQGGHSDKIDSYFQKQLDEKTRKRILFELADCFILLLDIAAHEGLTTYELIDAALDKHEINKKRKWGKPDENGVVEHIRE